MAKMQSTPLMKTALAAKGLAERLSVLRNKVEADRGTYVGAMRYVRDTEAALLKGNLDEARDAYDDLLKLMQQSETDAVVRAGSVETIELARGREEEIEEAGGGKVSVLTRDGLLWLSKKRRLTGDALNAAHRYRRDYGAAHLGGVGSFLGDPERSHKTYLGFAPSEARTAAIKALEDAHIKGLNGDEASRWLLNEVAGMGRMPIDLAKGNRHEGDRLETEFLMACRLLARHYASLTRRSA